MKKITIMVLLLLTISLLFSCNQEDSNYRPTPIPKKYYLYKTDDGWRICIEGYKCVHPDPAGVQFLGELKRKLLNDEFSLAENLTIKKIGGHSVGSCIVLAENYVFCGDECYYEKCLTDRICTGSSYNKEASEKFIVEFSKNKYISLLFHDIKILQGRLGYSIIRN